MSEGTLNMKILKFPDNSVWAVRIASDSYDVLHTIACFEDIRDAAWYLKCTGVKAFIEPLNKESCLVRDITVNPSSNRTGWIW